MPQQRPLVVELRCNHLRDCNIKYKINRKLYLPKEVESVFIKIFSDKLYKHTSMQNCKFNFDFMENLDKIKQESKKTIPPGDFNLNLIKQVRKTVVNQFLEIALFNNFMSLKTLTTKLAQILATLIDNIVINHHGYKCIR